MTLHQAQQQLSITLSALYDNREAASMADWVMEKLTGLRKIDRIVRKQEPLSAAQKTQLETWTAQLLQHRPIQYVLNEAWFDGLALYVDETVLIPRPETEELVHWIVEDFGQPAGSPTIMDIGTGSGCIPIALKKRLPAATLLGIDISVGALATAARNASGQELAIDFHQLDVLDQAEWYRLPAIDILVSNPPYIPQSDQAGMQPNVLQYEPHTALFVENNDPLLFYRALAELGQQKLSAGGRLYVEIHEDLGPQTSQLFRDHNFREVELKKDMQGKDRMIRCIL
ncbi:MAG: peptide chain release factor N(5)-glutamine methyltransferase [Candidatus Pseudobacter hemicellulosilyticus]|uniref:peptide chain release factor N(5)-glutamine methyltransferase n=1 Tax=Candidatus Pseudobacter hemicellulosilyticus TaxID=3121375 RepID=A0AAJ5WTG2_9BACT|nr:MAG: peptide chain release factor N(5)-glutamine methyltransferase [Pseudobacter sp.]